MYKNLQQKRQSKPLRDVGVRRHRFVGRPAEVSLSTCPPFPQIPRNRLVPGVVVLVHWPYSDEDESKLRPAVVISCSGSHVELVKGSGSPRRRANRWNVELQDIEMAGLRRGTGIDPRAAVLPMTAIWKITGALAERDLAVLLPRVVAAGSPAGLQPQHAAAA